MIIANLRGHVLVLSNEKGEEWTMKLAEPDLSALLDMGISDDEADFPEQE